MAAVAAVAGGGGGERDDFLETLEKCHGTFYAAPPASLLPSTHRPIDSTAHAPTEAADPKHYRAVTEEEIAHLEQHGNVAMEGWDEVHVRKGESLLPAEGEPARVVRCYFGYEVFLHGSFDGSLGDHQSGLYDSTLAWCVVDGPDVLVQANRLLHSVHIQEGAIVVGNGSLGGWKTSLTDFTQPFACGHTIKVGSEVAGRPVKVYPGVTMREVVAQALPTMPCEPPFNREEYVHWLDEDYRKRVTGFVMPRGKKSGAHIVIASSALVRNCPRISGDCFIGPFATLENADVEDSTILSSIVEETSITGGSLVHRSVLQWGVKVGGHSIVRDSLLMEHSSVDTEGKLSHVIACPDAGIATGECHHSLVGPFVGFHHQSLLIAALWPKGRGNVAYGAKIGSNHTGRAADQECLLGEGVFFGLGSMVKLPVNLAASPYTLVAADTSLEQQRLHFPFSLVAPCRDLKCLMALGKTGVNSLSPGWVLKSSPYTVFRNEAKFSQRSKSRRHKQQVTEPIFRPEIVDLIIEARDRLRRLLLVKREEGGQKRLKREEGGAAPQEEAFFTSKELEGAGANVVSYKAAEQGVAAYTEWIKRYALRGLRDKLLRRGTGETAEQAHVWQHQRAVLQTEFIAEAFEGSLDLTPLLQDLEAIETRVVAAVEESKRRDEVRGAEILDDYRETHPLLAEDAVIQAAKSGLREVQAFVTAWCQDVTNDAVLQLDNV